jgi:ADP-ribose pyrophosphatase YjhB (NUDIX family)
MFGGGFEPGEMLQEAAVREIEEEIGLTPAAEYLKLIGTMQMAANAPLGRIRLGEGNGQFSGLPCRGG